MRKLGVYSGLSGLPGRWEAQRGCGLGRERRGRGTV